MPTKEMQATRHTVSDDCPIERAIQTIGGKWKMLVLRSLLLNGPQRYNELLVTVARINAKELTRHLRELQEAGLVVHQSTDRKRAAAYALTELGSTLLPTFEALAPFGEQLANRAHRGP
jgi:DNA-binding HxlR family transcriptional regulator